MSDFRNDLRSVINEHSKEQNSDTPDFILAKYLEKCLEAFDETIQEREHWYNREIQNTTRKING